MSLEWAIQTLGQYGLLGIFLVVAMEYACLPFPSEIILPLSGLAAAAAGLPLTLVVAVSVLAGLVGSTACYLIGALGGRPLLDRMLKKFPRAAQALTATDTWQKEMGGLSVMIARVIPLFRTWVSFAAGLSRQPILLFWLYSAMGMVIWNTALILAGYYLYVSGATLEMERWIWLAPVAGFLIAALVFFRRRRKTAKGNPSS